MELLETSIYVILDFCINETAEKKSAIKFPISKVEAKQVISLGNEML
jgi:hypothetical protein